MSKDKKKEKKIYIDDGSTISDMSNVGKGFADDDFVYRGSMPGKRPTFKECWRTYIEAVKMMIIPMLITIGLIGIAFLLVYLIL